MNNDIVCIYISAPFRIFTTNISGREYGILENKKIQNRLESIDLTISQLGYKPFLPHRDEGKWGQNYICPNDVTEVCFQLIDKSQALVVFPGQSRGVHIEIGYATALGKKLLVLLEENEQESTLLMGLSKFTKAQIFRYMSWEEALQIIKQQLPSLICE